MDRPLSFGRLCLRPPVRPRLRPRLGLSMILIVLSLATVGCQTVLTTAAYLIYGTNVDARCSELKEKRVAVVVRPPTVDISADQQSGARELAKKIGYRLQQNVYGIEVIDQQEVDNWQDGLRNDRDDARELGKALEAEMVVSVELENFRLHDSTGVFRGRADYRIVVYDLNNNGKVEYEFEPIQEAVYPPNVGIPIGTKRRAEFRKIFVEALGEEIARHFYPHDSTIDFAKDSESLQYH